MRFFLCLFIVGILAGCASLPTGFEKPVSTAFTDTQNTALGKQDAQRQEGHGDQSGFHLLGNGLDAFVARAVLAEKSERSLDVQYYLYHNDLIGLLFTQQLLKAADRGVRVRLLVDDMDTSGKDRGIMAMDNHPNIEVRIFNPFARNVGRISQFITRMGSVTRRMHNKTFTADNQETILGGRNIGNEYFEADPDLAFTDMDVLAIGPVAQRVSSVFDLYWNSELAYPISALYLGKPLTDEEAATMRANLAGRIEEQHASVYLDALRNSAFARMIAENRLKFYWGDAEVVFDQPEKLIHEFDETQYHLSPMLKPYWEGVEKDLIVFSPYFVPGKTGTEYLTGLVKKGVRVRILTNSLASNDVGLVHAGYEKYRKKLLRGGVALYELNKKMTRKERKVKKGGKGLSKASLHAKSFVFDRKQVFIGSLNLDPRALMHNTEIGVVLKVPDIAEKMARFFDRNVDRIAFKVELKRDDDGFEKLFWTGYENGEKVVFKHEPYTSFWRRLGIDFMSLWPIDSQL